MNRRKLLLLGVPAALILLVLILVLALRGPSGPVVVCLDPGHGGSAAGAVNGERMEKDDNLRVALRVRDLLESADADLTVVMTRTEDVDVGLEERTDFAKAQGATMFVAIHRNSGGASGIETWTAAKPKAGDTALAKAIQTRLLAVAETTDRGVRKGTAADADKNYFVLSHTAKIPSCLIELGFIDSDADNALLDAHLDEYAAAIADGILDAAGLK